MLTLFLTLDGVLHPEGTFVDNQGIARGTAGTRPFQWAGDFSRMAYSRDDDFVLCTPWLERMSLAQLREQAPPWMRTRIIGGCIPDDRPNDVQVGRRTGSYARAIQDYVRVHRIEDWVAVDRTSDGWPDHGPTRGRLHLCSPERGLSDRESLNELAEMLYRIKFESGIEYTMMLVVSQRDGLALWTKTQWRVNFRFPLADGVHDVPVTLVDDLRRESYVGEIRGYCGGSEHVLRLAVKALCTARYCSGSPLAPETLTKSWTSLSVLVGSGFAPLVAPRLYLLVEVIGKELRVTRMYDADSTDESIRPITAADGDAVMGRPR